MRVESDCCEAPIRHNNKCEPTCSVCGNICVPTAPKCTCGSNKESYPLEDARGIFCGIVCEDCVEEKKSQYRPEIFTDSDYWTDEPIDEY